MRLSNSLSSLPAEVLLLIFRNLPKLSDLVALIRCCSSLHDRVLPLLYNIAATDYPCMLPWACSHPSLAHLARQLLLHGADPSLLPLKWPRAIATESQEPLDRLRHVFLNADRFIPRDNCVSVLPDTSDPCPPPASTETYGLITIGESVQNGLPIPCLRSAWAWSCLHYAAMMGNILIVKFLIKHARQQGREALQSLLTSIACGYTQAGTKIPEVDSFPYGRSVRHSAQSGSDLAHWRLHTPLYAALQAGQDDIATILIEAMVDAEIDLRLEAPRDVLHFATRYGCVGAMRSLVRAGVGVNSRDYDGWTALSHTIILKRETDVFGCLLSLGADVNASLDQEGLQAAGCSRGLTHLHLACWEREWGHAISLLKAGAKPEVIYIPEPEAPYVEEEDLMDADEWWLFEGSDGPFRPIDLVCLETCFPCQPITDDRVELLRALLEEHHVYTGPCPGRILADRFSPIVMAAVDHEGDAKLLSVFHVAGHSFEDDGDIVRKVLEFGSRPWTYRVLLWLFDHGARTRSDADNCSLFTIVTKLIQAEIRIGRGKIAVAYLQLLLQKGALDPDIRGEITLGYLDSGELELSKGRYCLFRAILLQNQPRKEFMPELIKVLLDHGVKPPKMVDVLCDFANRIPPMTVKEKSIGRPEPSASSLLPSHEIGNTDPQGWAEPLHGPERGPEKQMSDMLKLLQKDLISIIELLGDHLINPGLDELQKSLFPRDLEQTLRAGPGKEEGLSKSTFRRREAAILISELMDSLKQHTTEEAQA